MNSLKSKLLPVIIMVTTVVTGQQKLQKTSQTIEVDKEVTVELNLSHVEIEIDTWNKNSVKVEAFIESDDLSKEELRKALGAWELDIDGDGDYVEISSSGSIGSWAGIVHSDIDEETIDALRDLEIELADIPDIPELPDMPEIPEIPEMKFLKDMPEVPEFPELPELPEGMPNVNFDYEAYKKDGEAYLDRWSKDYEEKYGRDYKDQMRAWAKEFGKIDWKAYEKKMEAWGEKFGAQFGENFGKDFGKKMEVWGEKFGESFGKEYEKKMKVWGERLERQMESRAAMLADRMESHQEREANRQEHMVKRHSELAMRMKERQKSIDKRHSDLSRKLRMRNDTRVKKTLKITVPKKAKLKMNVRHGELKFSSLIHNLRADIAHASLLAENIDGSETSINVSYSPVLISNWNLGELKLNFVEKAQIKNVERLVLSSNSSNITLENILGSAIIDGSFGDLYIDKINDSFKNINLVLENSDAHIDLPDTSYNLLYKGNRSRLSHPKSKDERASTFSIGDLANDKMIVVNSKFSRIIMQ